MVDPISDELTWLRVIYDNVRVGILLINAKTRKIVEANPEALNILDFPREHIIEHNCYRILCPDGTRNCPILTTGQNVQNVERAILTGSGKFLPVLTSVVNLKLNNHPFLVETILDNTRRKGIEDQLAWQSEIIAGVNRVFQESLSGENVRDLARTSLNVTEELTGSQMGLIMEYKDDHSLGIIAISDTLQEDEVMQEGLKEVLSSN